MIADAQLPPLQKPRYAQAELLRLVPGLTSKSLRNWLDRGVIEVPTPPPGKAGKLFWAPEAVVAFRLVVDLIALGLKPNDAIPLGIDLTDHIEAFLELHTPPASEDVSDLEFVIPVDELPRWRRGAVVRHAGEDGPRLVVIEGDIDRLFIPEVHIAIEVDRVIASAMNAIISYEHERAESKR